MDKNRDDPEEEMGTFGDTGDGMSDERGPRRALAVGDDIGTNYDDEM